MKRTPAAILTVTVSILAGCQSTGGGARVNAQARDALGLKYCQVVRQSVDRTPGRRLAVTMPIDGRDYRVDLWPRSVRADGYQVLMQDERGRISPYRAGPVRTLDGAVLGRPGCRVAGSVLQDGLHLLIRLEDGRRCYLEPVPGAANDYAVYEGKDVLPTGGVCNMPGADAGGPPAGGDRSDVSQAGTVVVARIACDTDTEFVAAQGSISATEARINAIINAVNVQYESEVGIRHEISTILVRPDSDPYTQTGAQARLCQFIEEWTSSRIDVDRDVAHLFTGVNLTGGVIGIAADIGGTGICVSQGDCEGGRFGTFGSYCIVQSDFSRSFACATDLSAHELGHLWGAFHCICPSSTMNPTITCANTFSDRSARSVTQYRDTRDCLEEPQP